LGEEQLRKGSLKKERIFSESLIEKEGEVLLEAPSGILGDQVRAKGVLFKEKWS